MISNGGSFSRPGGVDGSTVFFGMPSLNYVRRSIATRISKLSPFMLRTRSSHDHFGSFVGSWPHFWSELLGTSLVGTEISDFLDRGPASGSAENGVGYGWGALILTSCLVVVFLIWRATGQTYDVENIATRKGEILYWTAILLSNTLGTAGGDWLVHGVGPGFRNAFLVIAGIMGVIVALHYLTDVNGIVLFWIAFVLTRPLGAAGGDALTKPTADGGLGWGTVGASIALFDLFVLLVVIETILLLRRPLGFIPYPVHRRTGEP
jgi:uncharacterized membrane-anchored protein